MATSSISTSSYANFATLVGVYDSTLYGGIVIDTSTNFGTGDLTLSSANSQYLLNSNNYVSPAAALGNGMTVSAWFFPSGQQVANSVIFDISSTLTSSSFNLTCGVGSVPILTACYNGVTLASTKAVNLNAWNYVAYTVMFNGTTASQFIYLNGSLAGTNSTATYSPSVTYNTNMIGYGPGLAYFNGKVDEFRFYTRVLTLPEANVLYNYNYQGTSTITPAITTMVADASNGAVVLSVNGTFSYLAINRTVSSGTTGTAASYNVSCAATLSSNNYSLVIWKDDPTTLTTGNTYTYTVIPYVMNIAGTATTVSATL
jgi:hypothetical protein